MAQYARPESVIANPGSSWGVSGAATIPEAIDETSPSDSDYIYTPDEAANLIVEFSDVTDPQSSSGHTVRVRWRSLRDSTPPEKGTMALYCSTTPIRVLATDETLPTSWTTETYDLTTTEADNITDYGALRLHAYANTLGSNEEMQISWAEIEVPNVPTAGGASNLMLLGVG